MPTPIPFADDCGTPAWRAPPRPASRMAAAPWLAWMCFQSPLIVNRRNRWGSYERCAIDANVAMQVGEQQCRAVDAKVQDDLEVQRTCARARLRLR